MKLKYLFALIAAVLMITFLGAIFHHLQQFSVGGVMLVGIAMMLYDLWQSLQGKD